MLIVLVFIVFFVRSPVHLAQKKKHLDNWDFPISNCDIEILSISHSCYSLLRLAITEKHLLLKKSFAFTRVENSPFIEKFIFKSQVNSQEEDDMGNRRC